MDSGKIHRGRQSFEDDMKRILVVSAALAAAFGAACTVPSLAQTGCLEGRTASGQCVNAGLASAVQQIGVIFSQPKISYTAFPLLPSGDTQFRYPYNLIPDQMRPAAAGVLPPPNPNP
jgi:hypothetical protein